MTKYKNFTPNMYKNIKEVCSIDFECPVCHEMLWTDSETDYIQCQCGDKYHVSAVLFQVLVNGEK